MEDEMRPDELVKAIKVAAQDPHVLESIHLQLVSAVELLEQGRIESATRGIRNELSKVGKENERLRWQLHKLNLAHARAKKNLARKSEEHKAMHRAARAVIDSADWTPVGPNVLVPFPRLADLKVVLPIIITRARKS
jgi:hypothetical protein